MSDGAEEIEQELADAVRDRAEAARVDRRIAEARTRRRQAEALVAERAAALRSEESDVARLESFSPTRIWAGLTGRRDADLDRETAERDAARYALAEAEARCEVVRREEAGLVGERERLGDVDGRYTGALEAKEAWLRSAGDPAAARSLADLAERRGALIAQQRELAEAAQAGTAARDQLRRAADRLGSAESWSTWDTFGGGGLLTDMMKYDRLDQATEALRRADQALQSFARELDDIAMTAVPAVEITSMTRTFDVFFDNIFSDWAVRSRVQDAAERTHAAYAAVEAALAEVGRRTDRVVEQLDGIERDRERLLLG